ncbi:roadblock/LC7 domain-containing protein [Guyparkeria sp.]|uniref:roadblock/LC7 domain-containing protein n=1 Tax=Guyparkeria sp. TaxID=2035736 RepID=UPI0035617778
MNFSDSMKNAAGGAVDELVTAVGSIRAAVVSTEDGFELVARARDASQVARLSAMASSMAALGVMAGEECEIGGFRSITLEAEDGFIVMLQSRNPASNLILSVIADSEALVGKVILYGRKAATQLARAS